MRNLTSQIWSLEACVLFAEQQQWPCKGCCRRKQGRSKQGRKQRLQQTQAKQILLLIRLTAASICFCCSQCCQGVCSQFACKYPYSQGRCLFCCRSNNCIHDQTKYFKKQKIKRQKACKAMSILLQELPFCPGAAGRQCARCRQAVLQGRQLGAGRQGPYCSCCIGTESAIEAERHQGRCRLQLFCLTMDAAASLCCCCCCSHCC